MINKLYKRLANQVRTAIIEVSFDTGEIGAYRAYFDEPVEIIGLRSRVQKALADTNAGTITGANADGNSTAGVLTHSASAAIGDEQTAEPTTNTRVAKGSYYQLTTAKGNAGGKATVYITYKTRG